MTSSNLRYFSGIGFFKERAIALKLIENISKTLIDNGVDYCLMFGSLLGKLRHDDIIPWDDDIDIIVFDVELFESLCITKLNKFGYVVLPDKRPIENVDAISADEKWLNCGYRIYREDGIPVPGQKWKFPWVGVWQPLYSGKTFTLAPEEHIYQKADFFPLKTVQFQGFPVLIPKHSYEILSDYYHADNWMEICVPPELNHREYKKTNAPHCEIPLSEVLAYLSTLDKPAN